MKATAADVGKNFGQYADKALVEPVVVTKYGRDHLVILSADAYTRLIQHRRAWRTADAPADVVDAVREARMDPRHDHLDQLLTDDRA